MCSLPLEFNDLERVNIHPQPEQDILLLPGEGHDLCPVSGGDIMMDSPETD